MALPKPRAREGHFRDIASRWLPNGCLRNGLRPVQYGPGLKSPYIGYFHSTRDTTGRAPCSLFRFQKLFLLRNVDRGVIDLKENCGLYLCAVFDHAVRICHAKRYVFAFGVRALFFLCGHLFVLVVGSRVIAHSKASALLPHGLDGVCEGVAAHASPTPGLPAQECALVCWGASCSTRPGGAP